SYVASSELRLVFSRRCPRGRAMRGPLRAMIGLCVSLRSVRLRLRPGFVLWLGGGGSDMTDAAAIGQRDEAVVQALVAGRSVRVVRREFSLTVNELDQALERCFPLDTSARLRQIRGDLSKLERLIEKFYLKALAGDGDVNSAILVVKAWERKAALLGLDAVQR